jgi:hypothetical protein
MKNRIITGTAAIAGGALVALGPWKLFKICDQSHHTEATTCYWTGRAAIGIGIMLIVFGITYCFFRSPKTRLGLSIGIVLTVVLLFLTANILIGVCEMPEMACRLRTLPALNVISALGFIAAVINTVYLLKEPADKTSGSLL